MIFRAFLLPVILFWSLSSTALHGQSQLRDYNFEVLVQSDEPGAAITQTLRGNERKNNSQNRLSMISESQNDYPDPASGCGPIALLNTLIWYEKYGLITPFFRESESQTYKNRLFTEIDRRLLEQSGVKRSEREGSRNMDIAMVLDEIVREQSDGQLRVHTDYFAAPLQLSHLLDTMPNFRTGYLLGYPKDPKTGEILNLHAAILIRADRAGYITLATWGQKYHGILHQRNDGQWFIPQDSKQAEIKIVGMMRFIPFKPIVDANQ